MRFFQRQSGFSLVETMVVIGVLAVIGVIMTDILKRTITTDTKTELTGTIKNNGDKALNTMDSVIQFADRVVCVGKFSTNNDTIVVIKDGSYTRFRFIGPSGNQNGYLQEDQFTLTDPTKATTALCSQSTTYNPVTITDTDPVTGVSLVAGSFLDDPSPGFKDVVNISFNLAPGVNIGPGAQNQVGGSVSFSTSVELR